MNRPPKPVPRVLIIDDSPSARLSLKTFLQDHGYESLCAGSAEEGMEMIERLRPDLILLDVMMERPYSGFHMCARLKGDPGLRHIPIIGISGMAESLGIRYSPEGDREFFNPDEYLEKPLDFQELLEKIRALLGAA